MAKKRQKATKKSSKPTTKKKATTSKRKRKTTKKTKQSPILAIPEEIIETYEEYPKAMSTGMIVALALGIVTLGVGGYFLVKSLTTTTTNNTTSGFGWMPNMYNY